MDVTALTLPKRSARSKKPQRVQTMLLWTLYVSLPQVIMRSEYLPDASKLTLSVNHSCHMFGTNTYSLAMSACCLRAESAMVWTQVARVVRLEDMSWGM